MMMAEPSKIVGVVVRRIMVEVGDLLTYRLPAQTTTGVGIVEPCDSPSLGLVSLWFGCNFLYNFCHG